VGQGSKEVKGGGAEKGAKGGGQGRRQREGAKGAKAGKLYSLNLLEFKAPARSEFQVAEPQQSPPTWAAMGPG